MLSATGEEDEGIPSRRGKKARRWRDKFAEAFRGVVLGIRGHSSFFVHFFCAALAVTAAFVLECDIIEWCIVIGCIGMVIAAELFNSTIETLFHGLDEETQGRIHGCLDIAAGAVLVAGLTSTVVGVLIFGRHILIMLHILET